MDNNTKGSRRSLIDQNETYVSRSAYKLASVAEIFKLDFKNRVVLDVGSSTGGFTDFALKHGAASVFAVEKGTNQMDRLLRLNPLVKLFEKTDVRDFKPDLSIDVVLIDVSFVSLKDILPHIAAISSKQTIIVAMAKPQFETRDAQLKNKGVIKNERIRRDILSDLELWLKSGFKILAKADSKIEGVKGNKERFYKLQAFN